MHRVRGDTHLLMLLQPFPLFRDKRSPVLAHLLAIPLACMCLEVLHIHHSATPPRRRPQSVSVFNGADRPQLNPLLAHLRRQERLHGPRLVRGVVAYSPAGPRIVLPCHGELRRTETFYYRTVGFGVGRSWIPLLQAGLGVERLFEVPS